MRVAGRSGCRGTAGGVWHMVSKMRALFLAPRPSGVGSRWAGRSRPVCAAPTFACLGKKPHLVLHRASGLAVADMQKTVFYAKATQSRRSGAPGTQCTGHGAPSPSSKFSSFRSRCVMPCTCKYSTPLRTCRETSFLSAHCTVLSAKPSANAIVPSDIDIQCVVFLHHSASKKMNIKF